MKVTIVSGDGGSVHFFRVKADDLEKILDTVLKSISDTSWLNELDEKFLEDCYKLRAEATIKDIEKKFKACDGSNVSSEAGEYIVSELARETLKNELGYMPAPLSELLGKKKSGNPGFDFHHENQTSKIILFGEAKYKNNQSAYTDALKQIVRFISEKKDESDIADLRDFFSKESLRKVTDTSKSKRERKGFTAAFSTKEKSDQKIIEKIIKKDTYKELGLYNELILVAVEV